MRQSILITGISSGVGLALAKKLLQQGHLVFGSVRSLEGAAQVKETLDGDFVPLVFDITQEDQLAAAAEEAKSVLAERKSGLTTIINSAGATELGPLLHVSLDDFRRQLDTLVVGQLLAIQNFHDLLVPQSDSAPPSRIYNISSVSGVQGYPFFGCYAAGKHALEGLSKSLREELKDERINVIVIAPGNIQTAIWGKQTAALLERYSETQYSGALLDLHRFITRSVPKEAMTCEEFADAFLEIHNEPVPAPRYSVIRSRKHRLPFSPMVTKWFPD